MGRNGREDGQRREPIGGFVLTDVVRRRLNEAPHVVIESPAVGRVSVVYGRRREAGDPAHSVFYRVEFPSGAVREEAIGASTRENAVNSIGRGVPQLVWEYEARQRKLREEERHRRQAAAQSRPRTVRREPVVDETDPDVQKMHETGEVPRRLRVWKSDMF